MDNFRNIPSERNLVATLRLYARADSQKPAFIFLKDGEIESERLDYAELDRRARCVAQRLQARGLSGEPVLLLMPSGSAYVTAFLGCLYAGAVAVPLFPPQSRKHARRLAAVLQDSGASTALCTEQVLAQVGRSGRTEALGRAFASLEWLSIDSWLTDPDLWQMPALCSSTLAYLQYTSGSTGDPKGVRVTHGNIIDNCAKLRDCDPGGTTPVLVNWLPLFHDMGLVGCLLQPFLSGATSVLMPPTAFLQKPLRWLQALSNYEGSCAFAPNFAYELCLSQVPDEALSKLHLQHWRQAFNGAEPVRWETLRRFSARFAACGFSERAFLPGYGLAEATLLVSAARANWSHGPRLRCLDPEALRLGRALDLEGGVPLLSCGRPGDDELRIVDPLSLHCLGRDQVGEIWLRGASVADGYWRRDEASRACFGARTADGQGPFLRSGDLGFLDHELFITGRLKDLILIRGSNYYPQDLEAVVGDAHPDLRVEGANGTACFSLGEPEALIVVSEVSRSAQRKLDAEAICRAIAAAIAEAFELAVSEIVLLKPGRVPKTSSGKIQRGACKQAFLEGFDEPLAHWRAGNSAQAEGPLLAAPLAFDLPTRRAQLCACLDQALRELLPGSTAFAPERHLLDWGLDSLQLIRLRNRLDPLLGPLPLTLLLENPRIDALCDQLAALEPRADSVLELPSTPLFSRAQQRLLLLAQLQEPARYHVHFQLALYGQFSPLALQGCLSASIAHHQALRLVLRGSPLDPEPGLLEPWLPDLSILDLSSHDEATRRVEIERIQARESETPFAFAQALLRFRLLKLTDSQHLLMVTQHHLITDGWSIQLLLGEWSRDYAHLVAGKCLPNPTAAPYSQFAQLERARLECGAFEASRAYWQAQLAGLQPLRLGSAPAEPSQGGAHLRFTLAGPLAAGLLAQAKAGTLFPLLLGAYGLLLKRLGGARDFGIGTVFANRNQARFQDALGFFANTLVLRCDCDGNPAATSFLARLQERVLDAHRHQELPFDELVRSLAPDRSGENPLFQAGFVLEQEPKLEAPGLDWRLELPTLDGTPSRLAKFDLGLAMMVVGEKLLGEFEFPCARFETRQVRAFSGEFALLLELLLLAPTHSLAQIGRLAHKHSVALEAKVDPHFEGYFFERPELLANAEDAELLARWNQTALPFEAERCLHSFFEEQVARNPRALALSFEGQSLDYESLNRRANRLAQRLIAGGIRPDARVAICAPRAAERVVAMLAVLKAGGAFLPLDPSYPLERLALMFEDAAPQAILLHARPNPHFAAKLRARLEATRIGRQVEWLELEAERPSTSEDPDNPDPRQLGLNSQNLAYVIYTSGSTGRPKGVMVPHRGLANMVLAQRVAFGLSPASRVLQYASFSFDVCPYECMLALCNGAALILPPSGPVLAGEALAELLESERISHFVVPPAVLDGLPERAFPELKALISAADRLSEATARRWSHGARLFNAYGPTECSIQATQHHCNGAEGTPPIGHPLPNTQLYLLDECGQRLELGEEGELYIGGVGVTRGYLGQPGLSAERFVPDPFSGAGARLYRTGDLARFRADGALEFLGRRDGQLKLRGFRIEAGEIEARLCQLEGVRAAAIHCEGEGAATRLLAYIVPMEAAPQSCQLLSPEQSERLRASLARQLPEYMLPAKFLVIPSLPLNPNGKLDRKALPKPGLADDSAEDQTYEPPQGALEEKLARHWAEVLQLERIDRQAHFFRQGGHSLLAVKLIARIQSDFGQSLSLAEFFANPSFVQQAAALASATKPHLPKALLEKADPAQPQLSSNQRRLWFLAQFEASSAAYQLPLGLKIKGRLDPKALQQALTLIQTRHETLRSRFTSDPNTGQPRLSIAPPTPFQLSLQNLIRDTKTSNPSNLEGKMDVPTSGPNESEPTLEAQNLNNLIEDEQSNGGQPDGKS